MSRPAIFSHSATPAIQLHPVAESLKALHADSFSRAKNIAIASAPYYIQLSSILETAPILASESSMFTFPFTWNPKTEVFETHYNLPPTVSISFYHPLHSLFATWRSENIPSSIPKVPKPDRIPFSYFFSTLVTHAIQPLHAAFGYRFKQRIERDSFDNSISLVLTSPATPKSCLPLSLHFHSPIFCRVTPVTKTVMVPDPECLKDIISE